MEVLIVPFDSSLSAACWWLLEVWFTASSLLWLPRSRRFIRSCLQVRHLPCGPRVSFVTRVRVEKGCMALVAWISRRNSLEWRCLPQRLLRLTLPWPDWLFPVDMGQKYLLSIFASRRFGAFVHWVCVLANSPRAALRRNPLWHPPSVSSVMCRGGTDTSGLGVTICFHILLSGLGSHPSF